MFLKPKHTIKTLIEQFDYPRRGPGMMWNAVKDQIETRGGVVRLNTDVIRIHRRGAPSTAWPSPAMDIIARIYNWLVVFREG